MNKLPLAFYRRKNLFPTDLMGKLLITNIEGKQTSGRIVELEAYDGIIDRASHAYNSKRTLRNEMMYAAGGVAYVYICYGLHNLFNIVTNIADIPHAILIRSIEPVEGISHMLKRRNKSVADRDITSGPGNLSKALGIDISDNGCSLLENRICIADDGFSYKPSEIFTSHRIGMTSAGKDALLPYRYYIKGNPFVSVSPK